MWLQTFSFELNRIIFLLREGYRQVSFDGSVLQYRYMNTCESVATSADVHELKRALDRDSAMGVDVREPDEFRYERIAGSVNIPQNLLSEQIASLPKNKDIFIFCHTGIRSEQAAQMLRSKGYSNVRLVEGGIAAWKGAGLPVERSKGPIPIMRQVQIVAGSLALIGGLFPSLRWIAAFVGAGLIFAGVSGYCSMAKLLAFLPWNKTSKQNSCQ